MVLEYAPLVGVAQFQSEMRHQALGDLNGPENDAKDEPERWFYADQYAKANGSKLQLVKQWVDYLDHEKR